MAYISFPVMWFEGEYTNNKNSVNLSSYLLPDQDSIFVSKAAAVNQAFEFVANVASIETCGNIQGPRSSRWTFEEDSFLMSFIPRFGKHWTRAARELNVELHKGESIRQGRHCRERWRNHLNPLLKKTPWTENEDFILINNHMRKGNSWSAIAKYLPGRTEHSVKNRYSQLLSQATKKYEITRAEADEKLFNQLLKSKMKHGNVIQV